MYNHSKLLGTMREKGLTQNDLASKINMSAVTLRSKLKGDTQFNAVEMSNIMDVLGIPMEEITSYFFAH